MRGGVSQKTWSERFNFFGISGTHGNTGDSTGVFNNPSGHNARFLFDFCPVANIHASCIHMCFGIDRLLCTQRYTCGMYTGERNGMARVAQWSRDTAHDPGSRVRFPRGTRIPEGGWLSPLTPNKGVSNNGPLGYVADSSGHPRAPRDNRESSWC